MTTKNRSAILKAVKYTRREFSMMDLVFKNNILSVYDGRKMKENFIFNVDLNDFSIIYPSNKVSSDLAYMGHQITMVLESYYNDEILNNS